MTNIFDSTLFQEQLWPALTEVQRYLGNWIKSENFERDLILAYGENLPGDKVGKVLEALTTPLVIKSSTELGGALGGYVAATNRIYLSQELVTSGNQETLVAVILEELGHSIDAKLKQEDSAGDEGQILSALMRGEVISAQQLQGLKGEDDRITLWLEGQMVEMEKATLTVSNTNDSGAGSLRAVLASANDGDTITFSIAAGSTITLTSGQLNVVDSVTIDGDLNNDGTPDITISGNNSFRVLNINDGTGTVKTVTLDGLVITGGSVSGDGGGIYSSENLILNNSTVSTNSSTRHGGGLFAYGGTVTLNKSTVSTNSSNNGGGGLYADGGGLWARASTIILNNSTISANSSRRSGGLFAYGGIRDFQQIKSPENRNDNHY